MDSLDNIELLRGLIHYSMHIVAPGLLALIFFRTQWKIAWLIMVSAILIDLDHLLADPLFDPNRCSIGFHPLHSYWAIGVYIAMLFFSKTRIWATGLVWHIVTDYQDCFWL